MVGASGMVCAMGAQGATAAVATVRMALAAHLPPGGRALLALSGGPDSTALGLLTRRARPDAELVALHVRHGLRDDAADAAAAADIARLLGLRFERRSVRVGAGAGPEDAARRARYDAFAAAARELQALAVLVGHSADDQAETVLLRLARGAGTRGLAGMAAARPLNPVGDCADPVADPGASGRQAAVVLLRPLLGLRRELLRSLVTEAGLPVIADPTNADPSQRRARVRTAVLPALQALADAAGGTRDPVPLLCRAAGHARVDADALDSMAAAVLARELERWGPGRALQLAVLEGLPEALANRVLRGLLAPACGGTPSAAAVAAVRGLAARGAGMCQVAGRAGGVRVSAGGGRLAAVALSAGIAPRSVALAPIAPIAPMAPMAAMASVAWAPGRPLPRADVAPRAVALPELGLQLLLAAPERLEAGAPAAASPPGAAGRSPRAPFSLLDLSDEEALPHTLVLRGALPGDAVGAPGRTRRLARLLAGVPRALRPLVPVLADSTGPGRVRWAAGVADVPDAGAHPGSRAVRLERLG